jgi:hypothetical protein
LHERRNIDIFARDKLSAPLNDRHFYSEPGKGLPELAADWAATEQEHRFGFFLQLIENRFVRKIRHRLDAFDFWNRRATSGGDYEILRAQLLPSDFDFVRRNESGFTAKDIDAERFETFL